MAGKVRTSNANWRGLEIFGLSYYILNHNCQGTEQAQRVGRLLLTQIEMVTWQQVINRKLLGVNCSKPEEGKSHDRKVVTPKLFGARREMSKNPAGFYLIPEKSQQVLSI
jgi:hypothetical protein